MRIHMKKLLPYCWIILYLFMGWSATAWANNTQALVFDVHVEELAYSYSNVLHATPSFVHEYDFSCNFKKHDNCSEIDSSSCHGNHTMVCLKYRGSGLVDVYLGAYHVKAGEFSLFDLEKGRKINAVMKQHFVTSPQGDSEVGSYVVLPKSYIVLKIKKNSILSDLFD